MVKYGRACEFFFITPIVVHKEKLFPRQIPPKTTRNYAPRRATADFTIIQDISSINPLFFFKGNPISSLRKAYPYSFFVR